MLLSKVAVMLADAVAAADIVTAVPTTDTTVVPAGIPEPLIDTPAPTAVFAVVNVKVVVELVVPAAVKTPTGDSWLVTLGNAPNKGRVFVVLSMAVRFRPGCATNWFVAPPVES